LLSSPPSEKLLDAQAAALLVKCGDTVMVGGFGLVGKPLTLVNSLMDNPEATDLTVVSNNLGEPGKGLGRLLIDGRIRKAIGSFFTSNPDAVAAHANGSLEVELTPQGTLSEAIRAGGAGIAAFYVQTGAGTKLAVGRESREFEGVEYLLWPSLRANVALIKALKADAYGNLVYDKTARNFNPDMATAADLVIAEVDELVGVGELDPEAIVTPHVLVDHVVLSDLPARRSHD
jgi:3-oxoacid CoA-transferase A subunit